MLAHRQPQEGSGKEMSDDSTGGGPQFCANCGEPWTNDAAFCTACGNPAAPPARKKRYVAVVAAMATAVLLLGVAIVVGLTMFEAPSTADAQSTTTTPTTTVPSEPVDVAPPVEAEPVEMDSAALAVAHSDSVFKIETVGCGYEGVGSGFAIDANHVVTNWHVVANDPTPTILTRTGERLSGHVIGWEEDPDIAVIKLTRSVDSWLEWADTKDLSEGDEIVSFGYPLPDHDFTVTPGVIMSFVMEDEHRAAIRSDAQLDRGNSGGPSLATDGSVAGVVTQMDLNLSGFRFVPLIMTEADVSSTIERIIANPARPAADCSTVVDDVVDDSPTQPSDPGYAYPVTPFYTVILSSLQTGSTTYQGALNRAESLSAQHGFSTGVLLSDDFSSLRPGLWVVYTGVWYDRTLALDWAEYYRSIGIDSYARQIVE
jgi:S1-C subfamily serine protease